MINKKEEVAKQLQVLQRASNMSSGDNSSNKSLILSDNADQSKLLYSMAPSPGLNEGEFSTDYFRMYEYKVKPCGKTYVHVWSQCPFYHPGENARRRDPRKYSYTSLQCLQFRYNGICHKGDACDFAHGLFETWLHPGQYRTKICRDRELCTRPVCFFAHNESELRPIYEKTGHGEPKCPSPLPYPACSPQSIAFPKSSSTILQDHHQISDTRMLHNIKHTLLNEGVTNPQEFDEYLSELLQTGAMRFFRVVPTPDASGSFNYNGPFYRHDRFP